MKILGQNTNCTACIYHKGAKHVCVWSRGPEDARIMLVGEAPGFSEDKYGVPFIGTSGRWLDKALAEANLTDKVYITNVVKCQPAWNQTPTLENISTCSSLYLMRQIAQLKPTVIVTLGLIARQELLPSDMEAAKVYTLAYTDFIFGLIPTVHPSYVAREDQRGNKQPYQQLVDSLILARTI